MKYIIGHLKPDLDATVSVIALKYLYAHADFYGYADAKPVLSEPANNETKAIFKKFKATIPETIGKTTNKDQFILADHNEASQRYSGIKDEQVIDIVDHHKVVANFSTPIFITTKPWGSTSTIVYILMKRASVKPEKKLASLMISAILSDTVGLKSPTTTDVDKKTLKELNKIAGIKDLDALTLEIFKAKSNIANLTPIQIVTNDYKIFDFSDKKVLINQIETVEQDAVIKQKAKLTQAMTKVKAKENLDFIFCAITDVLKVNTKMLYLTEDGQNVLECAFDTKGKDGVTDIGPMMSRKKEFAPKIEKALTDSCCGQGCCGNCK
jgi:manganese-dependent inorganic pyrophosphatase